MKTILILGAGSLYADTISAVKKAGCRVVCADRNPNAPTRNLAHAFENVDIRDVNGLLQAAHRHHVDGIMPVNEFGVIPASEVAIILGLPGLPPEVARNCTSKECMRRLWRDAGILQPDYYIVRTSRQAIEAGLSLGYPFIMKPSSSCASRGVVVARDPKQVEGLFKEAVRFSDRREVVAEGYMDGEEFSVEAIVRRNRVSILAVALKEIIPTFPFRITNALNYGFSLSQDHRRDLESQLQKAVNALKLDDWLVHSEFILTRRGWEIIEIGARGGGGYIFGSIVEYVSGYPYVSALAKRVTGDDLPLPDNLRNRGSSFRFLIPSPGRLVSISGIDEAQSLPCVYRAEMWIKEGDVVPAVTNGTQRAGCVITRAHDFNTARKTGLKAHDLIRFKVELEAS